MKILLPLICFFSLGFYKIPAQNIVFSGQTAGMVAQLADTSISVNTACPQGMSCCTVEKDLNLDLNGDSLQDFSVKLFFVRHDCPASHVYAGILLNTTMQLCTYQPPELPWMKLTGTLPRVFPHVYDYGDTIRCGEVMFPTPWTTPGQWRSGSITNYVTGELIYGGVYKNHEYLGVRSIVQGDTLYGWVQLNFEVSYGMGGFAKCTVEGYAMQSGSASAVVEIPSGEDFVYPNPSNGLLQIKPAQTGAFHKMTLVNATGKLVKSVDFSGDYPANVDISEVPAGMYIVLLYSENKVYEQKILKF